MKYSFIFITLGCSSCCMRPSSFMISSCCISPSSSSSALVATLIILTANSSPVFLCCAFFTTAYPPVPSVSPSSYSSGKGRKFFLRELGSTSADVSRLCRLGADMFALRLISRPASCGGAARAPGTGMGFGPCAAGRMCVLGWRWRSPFHLERFALAALDPMAAAAAMPTRSDVELAPTAVAMLRRFTADWMGRIALSPGS
mmetsp:Transcript_21058/g.66744  ORF Transcript_21058/g.66744 Transcript_21058/m.66744 type:complete len:201 (-) Transcript_21058:486-1088(-)